MQTAATDTSFSPSDCCAAAPADRWSANRKILLAALAAVALGGAAAAGGWGWLVAAGIAPVLLSVLPCLAMCGFGLCMSRKANGGREGRAETPPTGVAILPREEGTA